MNKKFLIGAAVLGLASLTAYEWRRNSRIKTQPANTPREFKIHIHEFLNALATDAPFDTAQLADSFLFVKKRYDCSDFLVNSMLRAMYAYGDKLDKYEPGLHAKMKELLLGFKYHWDQPGNDSLCTWSENHQILFAGAEYLAGNLYPNEIFYNSGRKGSYHKARGKKRILNWCKRRMKWGFTEWYSNNYYLEDLAAMSNIEEFATDADVKHAMTQALHLIFFDMATQSLNGSFVSTGGRMYEDNKKSAKHGSQMNSVIAKAFDMDVIDSALPFNEELTLISVGMDANFLLNKSYNVPAVLKKIAKDSKPRIIKQSNSMDIDEGVANGVYGYGNMRYLYRLVTEQLASKGKTVLLQPPTQDEQLAAQWEMEAWTNHQVFAHSMAGLAKNNMMCSQFFAPLKPLNLTVLKPFYGVIAKMLNPITNGKATQRANTYTYRTPHYLMATAQKYLPGGYTDQQHIWHVTLSHDVCVFATHPSGELQEKGALSKSPGYWVGNGRNPHAMQHENKILAIYHLPNKKAPFESGLHNFTHAYFPVEKFDEVVMDETIAFGKLGETFVALASATPYVLSGNDELKQYGKKQFWACECGSATEETFDAFVKRIRKRKTYFTGNVLQWGELLLNYKENFYVNGQIQPEQYKRYDSAYCIAERGETAFTYKLGSTKVDVQI